MYRRKTNSNEVGQIMSASAKGKACVGVMFTSSESYCVVESGRNAFGWVSITPAKRECRWADVVL